MSTAKRVVMVATDGESTRLVYHQLDRAIGVHKVIIEQRVDTREFLRRRVAKLGLKTVAGQLLFKAFVDVPLQRKAQARIRAIKREFALDDAPIPEERILRVSSINAPEAMEHLRALEPNVVVVNGTRIISKKVLEAIGAPFINTHAGITPLYRGVHGGYWALANGDPEHCGVTVHLIDPGIDTGAILAQALIHPTPDDNYATYPILQCAAGIPLLIDAVKTALDGTIRQTPAPAGTSRLWSHPTFGQYVKARLRTGAR